MDEDANTMSSFWYFLAAVFLALGLMYLGGYIGGSNQHRVYSAAEGVNQLTGSQPSASGGCASCKWY